MARHREDLLDLYERMRAVETEQAVQRRLSEERHDNLEGKMDDLKELFMSSIAEIKAMIKILGESLGGRVTSLEQQPGKRALDQRERIAFEIVKWALFAAAGGGTLGAVISLIKGGP